MKVRLAVIDKDCGFQKWTVRTVLVGSIKDESALQAHRIPCYQWSRKDVVVPHTCTVTGEMELDIQEIIDLFERGEKTFDAVNKRLHDVPDVERNAVHLGLVENDRLDEQIAAEEAARKAL